MVFEKPYHLFAHNNTAYSRRKQTEMVGTTDRVSLRCNATTSGRFEIKFGVCNSQTIRASFLRKIWNRCGHGTNWSNIIGTSHGATRTQSMCALFVGIVGAQSLRKCVCAVSVVLWHHLPLFFPFCIILQQRACQKVSYCNKTCQIAHWKCHRKKCKRNKKKKK